VYDAYSLKTFSSLIYFSLDSERNDECVDAMISRGFFCVSHKLLGGSKNALIFYFCIFSGMKVNLVGTLGSKKI